MHKALEKLMGVPIGSERKRTRKALRYHLRLRLDPIGGSLALRSR